MTANLKNICIMDKRCTILYVFKWKDTKREYMERIFFIKKNIDLNKDGFEIISTGEAKIAYKVSPSGLIFTLTGDNECEDYFLKALLQKTYLKVDSKKLLSELQSKSHDRIKKLDIYFSNFNVRRHSDRISKKLFCLNM